MKILDLNNKKELKCWFHEKLFIYFKVIFFIKRGAMKKGHKIIIEL